MNLLSYLYEEGLKIEPEYYVPILPMVLVNGAEGIATGYSTLIPQFNPTDIVKQLMNKMEGKPLDKLKPWYKGYTGQFIESSTGYTTEGNCFRKEGPEPILVIDELPICKWTKDYKQYLETLITSELIEDM